MLKKISESTLLVESEGLQQGRGNSLAWLVVTSNSTTHLFAYKLEYILVHFHVSGKIKVHFPVRLKQLKCTTCWAQRDFLECLISYQGFVVKAYSGVAFGERLPMLKCNTSKCVGWIEWNLILRHRCDGSWIQIRYDVCVCVCGMGEMSMSLWRWMIWSWGLTSNLFHQSLGAFLSASKNHPDTHTHNVSFSYDPKLKVNFAASNEADENQRFKPAICTSGWNI